MTKRDKEARPQSPTRRPVRQRSSSRSKYVHQFQLPFDERSLCRLFLSAAGENYDAYDKPELTTPTPPEVEAIVSALLEIDARKRPTPHEFYEMAIDWSSRRGIVSDDSS